jgi:hypothetical protein
MFTFVSFVRSNICCTLLLLMEPISKNFTIWGINFEFCIQSGTPFSRYLHTLMNTCYHYELLTSHAGWSLYYSSADLITFILWNCSYHLSDTLTTSFAISLVRFETISHLVTNLQLVTLLITKLGTKYTFKLQMSNDLTTMVCQKNPHAISSGLWVISHITNQVGQL